MLIEEFLKQRIVGLKNEVGVYVTQAFPKLLYVLEDDNISEDSPYWHLTELAAQCTAKRMVPDYISEKVMLELKIDKNGNGNAYPCMGCRSFLTPYVDEDGKPNMDCMQGMKLLNDNSIDLIVTSPPYYNTKEYSSWNSYNDFLEWLRAVFTLAYYKLKEGRMCCVNLSVIIEPREKRSAESKRIPLPFHFVNLMEDIGFKFLEDIIWVKPEGAAKNRNGGFYRHRQPVAYKPNVINEYILVFQKPTPYLIDKIVRSYQGEIKEKSLVPDGYERSNVWYINPDTKSKHPAPYPELLSDKLIQYYSYYGDTVLDPFVGSGTTAKSAKQNNRNYIGFEIKKRILRFNTKETTKIIKEQGELYGRKRK